MKEKTTMTTREFDELMNTYAKVCEAIQLFETGNHSEYNKEDLDEQLDDIHRDMCRAASELAQEIIEAIDAGKTYSQKDVEYLNTLFCYCEECYDLCYTPELFDYNESYGNGVIDNIGADFDVIHNERTEYKHFSYSGFYNLLNVYGICTR